MKSTALTAIWSFCTLVEPSRPSSPPSEFVGIYFLIRGDEIVYVGQSGDVPRRVAAHYSANRRFRGQPPHAIPFDRAIAMRLPAGQLDAFESALIRGLRPDFNASAPRTPRDRDAAILEAFGLEVAA